MSRVELRELYIEDYAEETMISQLALQFGSTKVEPPLSFAPETLTVFVGPNGSGKSLLLRELHDYAEGGPQEGRKILNSLSLKLPDRPTAQQMLRSRQCRAGTGETVPEGNIRLLKQLPGSASIREANEEIVLTHVASAHDNPTKTIHNPTIFYHFVSLFTLTLDGRTRLALVEPQPAGDLLAPPQNHLTALFSSRAERLFVRQIIAEAFGLHFVIDPTHPGMLRIRLSQRPPADEQEEQALDERARNFHSAAIDIAEMSDGMKAFIGIACALMSSDFRIIIIDEPDAFLHPPLARNLGYRLTGIASDRGANVFVGTHSADFLMGCIEAGKPLNIIRLTYESRQPTARMLRADELSLLMRDPLLRTTDVLSGLFHRGAVVCEADVDRSFYQEINFRLLVDGTGIRDAVFLNAQNKQTVRRIVEPLRRMGIPAAAILDFDIFKGSDLAPVLAACAVPRELAHALTVLRGDLEQQFKSSGIDMKSGGVARLSGDSAVSCRSLIAQLAEYGIFIVPDGEVESWMRYTGVQASKSDWLSEIFRLMGTDPDGPGYIRPGSNDVWAFVRNIARWIHDPSRKGMRAG